MFLSHLTMVFPFLRLYYRRMEWANHHECMTVRRLDFGKGLIDVCFKVLSHHSPGQNDEQVSQTRQAYTVTRPNSSYVNKNLDGHHCILLPSGCESFELRSNLRHFKTYILKDLHYVLTALTLRNSLFCQQCVCVFCVDLGTNSDYFSIQH